MKTIIPYLIIAVSMVFFLVLRAIRPPGQKKPGIFRKIWRGIVHVWDFITGFG